MPSLASTASGRTEETLGNQQQDENSATDADPMRQGFADLGDNGCYVDIQRNIQLIDDPRESQGAHDDGQYVEPGSPLSERLEHHCNRRAVGGGTCEEKDEGCARREPLSSNDAAMGVEAVAQT